MENQVQVTPFEMVQEAIQWSGQQMQQGSCPLINWNNLTGREIHYQMNRMADRGFFDKASQDQINQILIGFIFVANCGFKHAQDCLKNYWL